MLLLFCKIVNKLLTNNSFIIKTDRKHLLPQTAPVLFDVAIDY